MPTEEPAEQPAPVGDWHADQPAAPAARTFAHGDVLEGYKSTSSGSWPGRPEYASIDWSNLREYWTADGRVVLVDGRQSIPSAVVTDVQARLDAMGVAGGIETPDANGIRPSQDLDLRMGHVGYELITVRPYPVAGSLEWRASTHHSTLFTGADRDTVVRLAQDWVATTSDPTEWLVSATTSP